VTAAAGLGVAAAAVVPYAIEGPGDSAFATAEPPARLSSVSPDCTSSGVILIVKAR
jgi:hypothetical protein